MALVGTNQRLKFYTEITNIQRKYLTKGIGNARSTQTSTRTMWRKSWTSTRYVRIWCIYRDYVSIRVQDYEMVDQR